MALPETATKTETVVRKVVSLVSGTGKPQAGVQRSLRGAGAEVGQMLRAVQAGAHLCTTACMRGKQ